MKTNPKLTKKVKAWAVVIRGGTYLRNWDYGPESGLAVIRSKSEAEDFVYNEGGEVIPCTIHYQLPKRK